MSVLDEAIILNNGSLMPKLGLNVTSQTDLTGPLNLGYRLFSLKKDQVTNLKGTVDKQHVLFQQLFLQYNLTKESNESTLEEEIGTELKNLGASYFDLVVLPASDNDEKNLTRWQVLEKLKTQGRIKSLAVSDFYLDNLQNLLAKADIKPVVDQINVADPSLVDFLKENKIMLEQELVKDKSDALTALAKQKKVTVNQLILKYELAQEHILLLDSD